ncbi:MAG: hypothetical protein QOH71_1721 [Blastocatellia bacterium]|jgi:hypothetical protein|nr:hypothetical protein [Blastocatellia bacterium]
MFPVNNNLCPRCINQSVVSTLVVYGELADCQKCAIRYAQHKCSTILGTVNFWLAFVDNQFTEPCPNCRQEMMLTSPAPSPSGLDGGRIVGGILVGLAIVGLISHFTQPPPAPRRPRRRNPNRERVEVWKRSYVYERDGRLCTYCGEFVQWGSEHIDHSVSRRNGGTNHLNNLRLACAPCNLSKGSLNARQFRY